ncbi:MAG TPA: hypothetical protein DCQ64_07145 [Candidatus Rokubacteria bacterium]|nr:hypothetical protein [Candidatus Rokubacteria bacterium]
MTRLGFLALLLLVLALSGCTAGLAGMSPEQLREAVKVKDANAGCIVLNTPYGRAVSVWMNSDKAVAGKITVKGDTCDTVLEGK